jgi:hypothetical protein
LGHVAPARGGLLHFVRRRRNILRRVGRTLATWVAGAALLARTLDGVTLEELRADPDLNPKRLMSRVSRFKYELHAEVQAPEVFLATESGDCDDFATMAAMVLREKGFTPRLFAVRMPGLTHVVCYVGEVGSYMDYNNRVYMRSLVKTKPEIREIADKVAKSFDSSWTTASEFIYTNQVKIMVSTVARAETFVVAPSANASGLTNKVSVRQLNIGF